MQLAAFTFAPYLLQTLVEIASGYLANNLIVAGWSIQHERQSAVADRWYSFFCFLILATTKHETPSASASSLLFSLIYATAGDGLSAFTFSCVSYSHSHI
jgi:hypothetical protein